MAPLTKVRPGDLIRADDWNTLIDHVLELEAAIGKVSTPEPEQPPEQPPEPDRPDRTPPPLASRLEFVGVVDRDPPTLAYVLRPAVSDEVRIEVDLRPTAIADLVEVEVVVDGDVVRRPFPVDRGRDVEIEVRAAKGVVREAGNLFVDVGARRVRISTQPSITVHVIGGTIDVEHTQMLALPQ